MNTNFIFSRTPQIHFGPGKLAQLPALLHRNGGRVLLVTGATSFRASPHCARLLQGLASENIHVDVVSFRGEPSPDFVDAVAADFRAQCLDWVIGIGGGSAIDAGKAIAAMLPQEGSVRDFLEGMATRQHDGRKIPFAAVPTSAGTGAEATKNAVLSIVGEHGFKRSLRHDSFMPDLALVDPELAMGCPPAVTAACGLDALTQLIEAYVSTQASPMTDALALNGLHHATDGFLRAYECGDDLDARTRMAYAALLSGIVLANAGLGLVHGFAGPIGGAIPMPHGEVCGTLLGETTRRTIEALQADPEKHATALAKYAQAGVILSGQSPASPQTDCQRLVDTLNDWIERTRIPRLGQYGMRIGDLPHILDQAHNKNNPVGLNRSQMKAILTARL